MQTLLKLWRMRWHPRLMIEPTFKWWVSKTLKKWQAIVAKVKSPMHKFGVELRHSVEEAYKIDKQNGNNYWQKAIEKEMSRVQVAFEKWVGGTIKEEAKKSSLDIKR